MKKIILLFAIHLLLLIYSHQTIHAQSFFPEENGIALKGVSDFDAFSLTSNWLNVETNRDRFDSNLDSAFKLGLRRDGVIVNSGAPNYLICSVSVAQSFGTVFYRYDINFYYYNSEGLHFLIWTSGGIVTVGVNNFSHESVAKSCVDTFSNEWLKQNPR